MGPWLRLAFVGAAVCAVPALAACGGGGEKKQAIREVRITNGAPDNVCYWDASVSRDGTRLLFQADLNVGGEIWTETLRRGNATGTREPVVRDVMGSSPVFVGRDRVAFIDEISTSDRELVITASDGSRRPIPTVDKPFELVATPDSKWLLYTVLVGEGEALHRVRADGGGDEEVFTDQWSVDGPVVSPDGTRIAYGRYQSGEDGVSEVWTANMDGSGRTKVADGFAPAWSPDGQRLAFIAPAGTAEDGLPLVQVFVADAAGGGEPTAITDSEQDKRGSLIWFDNGKVAYLYGSTLPENYCQLFAAPAP